VVRIEVIGAGTVECPAGERLLDVFDEARGLIGFGCRGATCGVCAVEVVEGGALLAAPDAIERMALEELEAGPAERLACRAVAGPASGLVRLRRQGGGSADGGPSR
jgi:ferredoxin